MVPSDTRKHAIDAVDTRKVGCCEKCSACLPKCCGCPWWLFLILALLLGLAALAALGYGRKLLDHFGSKGEDSAQPSPPPPSPGEVGEKEELSCNKDYFLFKGKCLHCPQESRWNGTNCVKQETVNKVFIARIVRNSSGEFVVENKTVDGEQGWTTGQPTSTHLSL